MSSAEQINDIVRRFVDDRDALEEHEYAVLAQAVRASPELALQLRDQLVMDEVLSQRLAIDRRQFDAQVQQRIADHVRGEDELNRQADELRSLALARLENEPRERTTNWSMWTSWGVALLVLLAAGAGVWLWQKSLSDSLLAQVESVAGQVLVKRFPNHNDELAQNGLPLRLGDKLVVGEDGLIKLRWSDGTSVQISGGSSVDLPATTTGKRVYIHQGDVAAVVAKQPSGRPMIFSTPHAEATVRGTELYLHVTDDNTRLDVAEGSVELAEHETHDVQLVETSQSATATVGAKITMNTVRWPTSQQGLVYLFAGSQRPVLVRHNGIMQASKLEPMGEGANFNAVGEMQLSGGWFEDRVAASDVASSIASSGAMSLEVVLAADQLDGATGNILRFTHDAQGQGSLRQDGKLIHVQAPNKNPVVIATLGEPSKLVHLTYTCDGRRWTSYLDGQLVDEEVHTGTQSEDVAHILPGILVGMHWHGRIAGLAIYDRVLTRDEITGNRP